ncbi:MAG TPA: T9SS type A sorting domain-containing protein [Candidatus Kapabacteria bacterium]|nr:T9SS type A sorting domain-containing protein [Candidatus Kapabacteria bacterium]
MKHAVQLVIFLISGIGVAHAQIQEKLWQPLAPFSNIKTVYFLDLPGPPRIGFVATDGNPGMLYRTTDGGNTWNAVSANNNNFVASDFTFKDSLTGWFSNSLNSGGVSCYKTTDGGMTWTSLTTPTESGTAILYRPQKHLLLLSGWGSIGGTSCYSTDEGSSWIVFRRNQNINGYAFLNDDTGVVTTRGGIALRTSDGGFTWQFVDYPPEETWQPLADIDNNLILAYSETGDKLSVSSDEGVRFDPVPNTTLATTGTTREGSCHQYYTQTVSFSGQTAQGIWWSADGHTWTPLLDINGNSGPSNIRDTRFYVKGTYVFAGGDTTSGKQDYLWRYVGDSTQYDGGRFPAPVASTNELHLPSSACGNIDTSLYLVYLNDCTPAEWISASVEPSDRFILLLPDTVPRQISGTLPIPISYVPLHGMTDTGALYLTFLVNGQNLYDTVRLISGIPPSRLTARFDVLVDSAKSATLSAGTDATITLRLLDGIPGSDGLDSVRFEMSFDSDLLSFQTFSVLPPWSLERESHTSNTETMVVRHLHGEDLSAKTDIVNLIYNTYLSRNISTTYSLGSLQMNDTVFEDCTVTAGLPDPAILTIEQCGDSTMRAFMNSEPILQIVSIATNANETTIELRAARNTNANLSIYNMLGECVRAIPSTIEKGEHIISVEGLRSGIYFVSIECDGNEAANSRFLIAR